MLLKKQNKVKDFKKLKWADKKCSLLTEDGECSIYEIRPLVCRAYNSIDNPINCNADKNKDGHERLFAIETEALQMALFLVDEGKYESLHKVVNYQPTQKR